MNRKADFLLNESIGIYSHNESNLIDSNRELECSIGKLGLSRLGCMHIDAPFYLSILLFFAIECSVSIFFAALFMFVGVDFVQ